MRKNRVSLALAIAAIAWLCATAQQSTYVPTQENLDAREQFQDNKLGVFIHWGVYSMLADGEWVKEIRVTAPEELVTEIREELEKALEKYKEQGE